MPSSMSPEQFLSRFPEVKEFVDCAGAKRKFQISVHISEGYGYHFRGHEITNSLNDYKFDAFSEATPIVAFSDLVMKIRRSLAQRYLDPTSQTPAMLHNEAEGHVSNGGVVIDGRFITWDQFTELLQSHEGWEFKLQFTSK